MTDRRQYCPRAHDTFVVGRDSSYRCLQCKREAGKAAREERRVALGIPSRAETGAAKAEQRRLQWEELLAADRARKEAERKRLHRENQWRRKRGLAPHTDMLLREY